MGDDVEEDGFEDDADETDGEDDDGYRGMYEKQTPLVQWEEANLNATSFTTSYIV